MAGNIKRFYKDVSIKNTHGQYTILLDGREILTPKKNILVSPSLYCAKRILVEWESQEKFVDYNNMPITRVCFAATDINKSELSNFKTQVPGRPHIASILKDKGHVSSINEAFIKYLGNGKIGDSRSHQPNIEKIINLAQESKCLVFLAHPHTLMSNDKYSKKENWINDSFFELVKELSEFGINGLEATYSSYSKNVTNQISEVAKKLNLLECGGSDYHGDIKPNINLGYGYENTPIKVPYEFLNDMKEKHGQL